VKFFLKNNPSTYLFDSKRIKQKRAFQGKIFFGKFGAKHSVPDARLNLARRFKNSVPEARLKLARRFNAGNGSCAISSPEGTIEPSPALQEPSAGGTVETSPTFQRGERKVRYFEPRRDD